MKMAMKKNLGELGICVFMIIVSMFFIALSDFQQHSNPIDPGPALFPRITAAFTILLSAIQIIVSLREKVKADAVESTEKSRKANRLKLFYVFGTLALTIVYVFLFDLIKYILLTPIFLAAVMFLLGVRKWTVIVSVAVIYGAVSYWLYAQVLMVPLP
jgi:putative tricarboxylic transport membrane protein